MKQFLLLLVLLLQLSHLRAQNYQCLQAGVKRYFINGNGYLRGMRIDSVRTVGSDVVYYPFHTIRGPYSDTAFGPLHFSDSSGGSWLGKKVIQQGDGTFIFDNHWGDSVVIKTQANIGDRWVFYSDSSTTHYIATVMNLDTMTILTGVDSIKKITINAFDTSGLAITSDSLDGLSIILSKNSGFAEVFDLYTFPYHKPNMAYTRGLDFFLDRSTSQPGEINYYGGHPPSKPITVFNLVNFINPTSQQLHNWSIGDRLLTSHSDGIPIYGPVTYIESLSQITGKTLSLHSTDYIISGGSYSSMYADGNICPGGAISYSDSVYPVIDTSQMPEDVRYGGDYIFYFPQDTSFCFYGPGYEAYYPSFNVGLGWMIQARAYKLGIGQTHFRHADGNPDYQYENLIGYCIDTTACGKLHRINVSRILNDKLELHPNPATNTLTVKTNTTTGFTVNIINMMGQVLVTQECRMQQETIDVSSLPNGVYNVSITDREGKRQNEVLTILH